MSDDKSRTLRGAGVAADGFSQTGTKVDHERPLDDHADIKRRASAGRAFESTEDSRSWTLEICEIISIDFMVLPSLTTDRIVALNTLLRLRYSFFRRRLGRRKVSDFTFLGLKVVCRSRLCQFRTEAGVWSKRNNKAPLSLLLARSIYPDNISSV